jgi:hypothetical protein
MTPKRKQQGIFHSPLNPKDTATQTEGCRHTNPDICANNALPNVCAFVRSDGVCLKPPKSWAKQFNRLKEASQEIEGNID